MTQRAPTGRPQSLSGRSYRLALIGSLSLQLIAGNLYACLWY